MYPINVNQPLKFFWDYSGGQLHTSGPVTEEFHAVSLVGWVLGFIFYFLAFCWSLKVHILLCR